MLYNNPQTQLLLPAGPAPAADSAAAARRRRPPLKLSVCKDQAISTSAAAFAVTITCKPGHSNIVYKNVQCMTLLA